MADVNITVDGKKITAPAGTLLIEACKSAGIEVPSFCYYPGLSLQGACRMCLVRIEKMPKLQTACTTVISEGMTVSSDNDEVRQARKAMLEMVLGNHPLDCPVCDAGGECELQDMTFTYGAAESKLIDIKNHRDEQQWSPVVYFDRPRCIMCYRCVRVCGEGMDVWALGIQNRGSAQVIAPNKQDYLWCEECGMCIDICPVGALTSGAYRYKTRPWEMHHVGTMCAHCGDGCKTTLGVRRADTGMDIVRGDNRDKSGINGDFLCVKGRYAFDFADDPRRLKQPMIRREGKLQPATWEEAIDLIGERFKQIKDADGGQAFGVIGSNRTTNEENYLLQKFARTVLGTNNIDHQRTADFPGFVSALAGQPGSQTRADFVRGGVEDCTASMRDVFSAPAILVIGNNPTDQHPLLAWQIRNNVRLHRARLYVVNAAPIKLRRQAAIFAQISEDNGESAFAHFLAGNEAAPSGLAAGETSAEILAQLRDKLRGEQQLVVAFGSELRAGGIAELVRALPQAKFICLGDYANSRGAADMGLYPDLLPGYVPVANAATKEEWYASAPNQPGLNLRQMFEAASDGRIKALYIVGSNPVARYGIDAFVLSKPFVVVQDMFLTETALPADVVLPAACAYEKSGTFTNTCGDLQMLRKAGEVEGAKSDFEIIVRIAGKIGYDIRQLVPFGRPLRADMGQSRGAQSGEADRHAVWLERHGLEPKMSPFDPLAMLDEIQRLVPGYDVSRLNLVAGNDEHTRIVPASSLPSHPELIVPSEDTLFTSGTLGRYSKTLNAVVENERKLPEDEQDQEVAV
ncbi:MAG: molybdopterin-dependent oxidoreductase [Acidobacteriia bacterium]|nr:molybdopterin-dependent oxidoreductase [Terriglobia bacterium]